MISLSRLLLAAGLCLCAGLRSQHHFLPLGVPAASAQYNVWQVDLGFAFTMPGGTTTTQLWADRHGRLYLPNAGNSQAASTGASLVYSQSGVIGVFWDSLSVPSDPYVFVFTDGSSVCSITWNGVGFGGGWTFQCQVYASGRIVMLYDSRCPVTNPVIGVSPGTGVTLPPPEDFSATLTGTPIVTPSPTVFEDFDVPQPSFDLQSSALEFIPTGAGGVLGWTVFATGGVVDPVVVPAASRTFAGGCYCRKTYRYEPDGSGGFDASAVAGSYDANIGTLVGATADDAITAVGVDLGFAMTFPDGLSHQFVDVDPNGRIAPTGAFGAVGDQSPSLADITGDGYPYYFGLWADWDVTRPESDGIYFTNVPGVSATFTWRDVAQYSFGAAQPCTWQIRLFANGDVHVTHEDLAGLNQIGASADDVAVGLTSGFASTASETDHSMLGATATSVPGIVFEWWDASSGTPNEPVDLRIAETPLLTSLQQPIEGGSWRVQAIEVAANAQFGLYIVGLSTQNTFLEPFGSPCLLSASADIVTLLPATGTGEIADYALPIPGAVGLLGTRVYAQCAVDGATSPLFSGFAGTPLRLAFSNALEGVIGSF